ncbi:penicillin-binding protein, partial [Candidatus Saccharibacteria bacterium]|nr:penicillin-binding protein [Candidatus Saccharibacteria bacterium]
GDGDYRLVVAGDQISTYMRQATVAIEDRNFYNHSGIDFWALVRATLSTITGRGVQGGSTLTQQLIKQVYFSDESGNRTVSGIPRKIKEAILAIEVEKMYDKEQIITMYLNESPYGGRRNGVESGAQAYFGKSAKDLTLAEAALLASIPNNPAVLNPYNEYGHEALIARQHKTLDVMVELGYISQEEANEAKEVNILDTIKPETSTYGDIKAPHFVLEVRDLLEQKYGVKTMRAGGYTIKTTLDLKAQGYAEQAVANGAALMGTNGSDNIALASVDVETAQVIAMVGSVDWNIAGYGETNAATSLLEPGSSIKPIIDYGPLFMQREGINYGPGSVLKDENIDSLYCAGYIGSCALRNASGRFYGNITIRNALGNYLNIPAVKALYINVIENSLNVAQDLSEKHYCAEENFSGGLAIAIGSGCNTTPIEHANAYASVARGGVYKELAYVLEVKDPSGNVVESWEDTEGERVYDEQVAYMLSNILSDASARTVTFGQQATSFGFVVPGVWTAPKTGTTTTTNASQAKDSWMMSYSTAVATAVWNGNHNGSALGNSSNTVVRRVVNDYMGPVHTDVYANAGKWKSGDQPARPAGIQNLTVNGKNDIWPSWYNSRNSGVSKETLTFNKYTHKLATDCTPEAQKIQIEATKSYDPITKREIWDVPEPYNRDETDDCSYKAPSISTFSGAGKLRATGSFGSVGSISYILTDNGKTVETGNVQKNADGSFAINFDYDLGGSLTGNVLKVTISSGDLSDSASCKVDKDKKCS